MLRARLAFLTLASGLLFTLSGCATTTGCDEGRLFPRLTNWSLFNRNRGIEADCDCHHAMTPPISEGGPVLMPPGAFPPPPVVNQPPQVLKVPQANPTPFVPAN